MQLFIYFCYEFILNKLNNAVLETFSCKHTHIILTELMIVWVELIFAHRNFPWTLEFFFSAPRLLKMLLLIKGQNEAWEQ